MRKSLCNHPLAQKLVTLFLKHSFFSLWNKSILSLCQAGDVFAECFRDVSLYDLTVTTIDGSIGTLADYRGLVLLIVNVASQCGFTPQYAGLEELYRRPFAAS